MIFGTILYWTVLYGTVLYMHLLGLCIDFVGFSFVTFAKKMNDNTCVRSVHKKLFKIKGKR